MVVCIEGKISSLHPVLKCGTDFKLYFKFPVISLHVLELKKWAFQIFRKASVYTGYFREDSEIVKYHNSETVTNGNLMLNGRVVKLNYRNFQNNL